MTKPRFQILIEAQPQADDPDGNRRLRMALKSMLRRHGLRCVTVMPATDPAVDAAGCTSTESKS